MGINFQPPGEDEIFTKYSQIEPLYQRLLDEVHFILEKNIDSKNIKIHTIQTRIKDFESFYNKIIRKKIKADPFEKITDIAGLRVICIYRSDLNKLEKLISNSFEVISSDAKTRTLGETEFGYMADHYIVKLSKECKGARYDEIKHCNCEIQVRTILMDAWDSVSHHLDYKRKTDIPTQLKKDFYALSGLFYVADTHFEIFKDSIEGIKTKLIEDLKKNQFNLDQDMNLDTLRTYASWKFPQRTDDDEPDYSEMLSELQATGHSTFRILNDELDQVIEITELWEKEMPPTEKINGKEEKVKFTRLGVIRSSLEILDPIFLKFCAARWGEDFEGLTDYFEIEKYRKMLIE